MRAAAPVLVIGTLAAPALAQVAADGNARAAHEAGVKIEQMAAAGGLTRAGMRDLMGAMLADGVDEAERDLLFEIADAKGFTLTIAAPDAGGERTVAVPAPADEVVMMAQLVTATPNLHQLWCVGGKPTEQLVELSRLSPAMFERLYIYIGNQMDDAWKNSTLANMYQPYSSALGCEWNALKTLPADIEMRTAGYDLLTTGLAYGIEKAKSEGRAPPADFLFAWVANETSKTSFVNGKPAPS